LTTSVEEEFFCDILARYITRRSAAFPRYVLIDFDNISLAKIREHLSRLCAKEVNVIPIRSYKDASQLVKAIHVRGNETPVIVGVQRNVLGFVASVTSVLRILENSLPSVISSPLIGTRNSGDLVDLIAWMCTEGREETLEALRTYTGNDRNLDNSSKTLWSVLNWRLLRHYPAFLPKFHPQRIVRFVRCLCSGKTFLEATLELNMIPSSRLHANTQDEYSFEDVAKWYENQLKVFSKLGNIRSTAKRRVHLKFLEKMVRSLIRKQSKNLYSKYMSRLSRDKRTPCYGVKLNEYLSSGVIGTAIGMADLFDFQILPRKIIDRKVLFDKVDNFSIKTMKSLKTDETYLRIDFIPSKNRLIARIKSVEGYLLGV